MNKELVYKEIEKSKYILDLQDNWDDEGSISYKYEVWKSAADLLLEMGDTITEIIEIPMISHGPHGSIDIFFNKNKTFKLLINIEDNNDFSYYLEFNDFIENTVLFNKIINFLNPKMKRYNITSENHNLEEDKVAYKRRHHCPACNMLKNGVKFRKAPKHICGK